MTPDKLTDHDLKACIDSAARDGVWHARAIESARDAQWQPLMDAKDEEIAALKAELESRRTDSLTRECLSIGKEIQRAAGELPDCYEIIIRLELGYGVVELVDPEYKITEFNDTVDGLSHCIREAIDAARSK